jgi:hypothetical protein
MLSIRAPIVSRRQDSRSGLELGFIAACVLMNRCWVLAELGRFADARQSGLRAASLALRQGDRRIRGMAHSYLSLSAAYGGDFADAECNGRVAVETLQGIDPTMPTALAALAQALLGQGRSAEALDCATDAYTLLLRLGRVEDGEALVRLLHAECLAAVGRHTEARAAVGRAAERLHERAVRIANPTWREAFLHRPVAHQRTWALLARLGGAPAEEELHPQPPQSSQGG